jgi:hypothetical protein
VNYELKSQKVRRWTKQGEKGKKEEEDAEEKGENVWKGSKEWTTEVKPAQEHRRPYQGHCRHLATIPFEDKLGRTNFVAALPSRLQPSYRQNLR